MNESENKTVESQLEQTLDNTRARLGETLQRFRDCAQRGDELSTTLLIERATLNARLEEIRNALQLLDQYPTRKDVVCHVDCTTRTPHTICTDAHGNRTPCRDGCACEETP